MISVVFDMDGVIFDSERLCCRCWMEYAEQFGLVSTEEMFYRCIGTTVERTERIVREYQGEAFDFENFRKITSDRFHEIEAAEGLPVKKGAAELLEYLKSQGAAVGLASSTRSETVIRELTHAGLISFFDVIVGGEMAARSKPAPDIYLEACRRLKVSPEKTFGIEDSFNGIRSLSAAGMYPVMVPDMLSPDEEMRKLAGIILPDLISVKEFFAENGNC